MFAKRKSRNIFSAFQPRFRIRENTPRFRLETQESQWSSRFSQNSFYPANDSRTDFLKNSKFDDEQEIVTAGPDNDEVRNLIVGRWSSNLLSSFRRKLIFSPPLQVLGLRALKTLPQSQTKPKTRNHRRIVKHMKSESC